jgi:hypothetical protein
MTFLATASGLIIERVRSIAIQDSNSDFKGICQTGLKLATHSDDPRIIHCLTVFTPI